MGATTASNTVLLLLLASKIWANVASLFHGHCLVVVDGVIDIDIWELSCFSYSRLISGVVSCSGSVNSGRHLVNTLS